MTILRCLPFFAAVLPAIWLGAGPGRGVSFDLPTGPDPVLVQTPAPDPGLTPAPAPEPTVEPSSTPEPTVITQIFKVVFSAETLYEALVEVMEAAAEQEITRIDAQTFLVTSLIVEIMKPPDYGSFADIATSTLSTAAFLAPALYLVRLVLYHWNRLLNEDDGLLRVFGDWLAAGFLAVAAGPFLDVVVHTGRWMAQAAIGETHLLAEQFIAATVVTGEQSNLLDSAGATIFAGLFAIAAGLGGLIGVVGLAAAFAVSQAVLFVLAIIAPILAVLAVVPQLQWMRGLWLKAVAVLGLLPVAAGGIFKAGMGLTVYFSGGGLSDILIRLFWLWGAVGFLLSLAGILGKVTLSTAVDATMKLGKGVKEIVSTAALVRGGAPAAAGTAGTSSKKAGVSSNSTNATSSHSPDPAGSLHAPQYTLSRTASAGSSSSGSPKAARPVGYLPSADSASLEPFFKAAGLELEAVRAEYPDEMSALAQAFSAHPDEIAASPDPLAEAARLADAGGIATHLRQHRRREPPS